MTEKIKRAAIQLKGIGLSDREWILKRLSTEERRKLDPILAELDNISFNQVLGLNDLMDINSSKKDELEKVVAISSSPQKSINLDPDIKDRLSKAMEKHSDIFLSILLDTRTNVKDTILSQVLDHVRYIRIKNIAQRRSIVFSSRITEILKAELLESAQNGGVNG